MLDHIQERGRKKAPRVLILVVAYNAESTIESVLNRVSKELTADFDLELLVLDDCSYDSTFVRSVRALNPESPLRTTVLRNPTNRGYGGNQKVGMEYAIQRDFNFLVLLHGDGQYAPERISEVLGPLVSGKADAVIGSRMLTQGGARRGGMPLYKLLGNRILTWVQNRLLGTNLSEFHSGYRAYSVSALAALPIKLNTDDFHFDTEILIQLFMGGYNIAEVEIPTYYGDEICYVNGLKYARDVALTTSRAFLQRFGVFYDPKFDIVQNEASLIYEPKLDFESPSTFVLKSTPPGERILDIGCGAGALAERLHDRGCFVVGIDRHKQDPVGFDQFLQTDLDIDPLPVNPGEFNTVLLLDVLEHMSAPEQFMAHIRESIWSSDGASPRIIASTPNIAFFPLRAMLMLGQFNYGKRGILDMTHRRLFTLRSFVRLMQQAGFTVESTIGVPPPLPMVLRSRLARAGFRITSMLAHLFPSLFAYQFVVVARAQSSLHSLLRDAEAEAERMGTGFSELRRQYL